MYSNHVTLDQFYTNEEVAKKMISSIDLSKFDTIIEPSAGTGAFYKNINGCIGIDLEPKCDGIICHDFLTWEKDINGHILFIGNPPFGKRNVLAKEFIKKASKMGAHTIAFILPDVFIKPTYSKVADGYNLKEIIKIEDNAFIVEGEPYHVPCSFFIWTKEDCNDLTWKPGTYTTKDFKFIASKDVTEGDITIKQAVSKTMAYGERIEGKTSGVYYIRPILKTKEELISIFNSIEYISYSSVNGGVSALCQEEIIKNYLDKVGIQ